MPPVTLASVAKEVGDVSTTLKVHLAECAILRKESIDAQRETRDAIKFAGKSFVAVVLALIGWLGVQVYNGVQASHAMTGQAQAATTALHQAEARAGR
jgi:hypothetical protein